MSSSSSDLVDILLSTFNGQAYLAQQLESLRDQTHQGWRLLARDDGSSDGTAEILREWAERDERITVIEGGGGNLGAAGSFLSLLEHSTGAYFAFCDQDDVWMPSKLTSLLSLAARGTEGPVAVFSDATLVDEQLSSICPSFFDYQGVDVASAVQWPRLLAQNVVVGATLVGNAALRAEIVSAPADPDAVIMHDWWTVLVAAALGRVDYLAEPTILYRQHRGNVLGSKGSGLRRVVNNLRRGESIAKPVRYVRRVARQAAHLDRCFGERLSPDERAALLSLVELTQHERLRLRDLVRCRRQGVAMTSWDQDLAVALSVLLFGWFPRFGR